MRNSEINKQLIKSFLMRRLEKLLRESENLQEKASPMLEWNGKTTNKRS
jgi:hypothetical protein